MRVSPAGAPGAKSILLVSCSNTLGKGTSHYEPTGRWFGEKEWERGQGGREKGDAKPRLWLQLYFSILLSAHLLLIEGHASG